MLWILLKLADQKGCVSRFMSTISHKENGLKTWEKNVRFNVLCWDCADLTDASGFNGVEQCEKCLSRCNNKVHRVTFIWMALPRSIFSFSLSLFLSVSHFVAQLTFVRVLFLLCDPLLYAKVVSAISTVSSFLVLHQNTEICTLLSIHQPIY